MANTKKSKIFGASRKVFTRGYDILGNIAIVKFDRDDKIKNKKKFSLVLMKKYPNLTTVLEKSGKFSGRLRTLKTKYILGEKTKEALYKENSCLFRFNVDTCYFSPRLASERKEIARLVKPRENVLVLFGGVAPFAIVIARPNLNDSFLDVSFKKIKKGGIVHYYGFYEEEKLNELKELIENEAKKAKKKIRVIRIKKAGDIGVKKYRYRVDLKV